MAAMACVAPLAAAFDAFVPAAFAAFTCSGLTHGWEADAAPPLLDGPVRDEEVAAASGATGGADGRSGTCWTFTGSTGMPTTTSPGPTPGGAAAGTAAGIRLCDSR